MSGLLCRCPGEGQRVLPCSRQVPEAWDASRINGAEITRAAQWPDVLAGRAVTPVNPTFGQGCELYMMPSANYFTLDRVLGHYNLQMTF